MEMCLVCSEGRDPEDFNEKNQKYKKISTLNVCNYRDCSLVYRM